MKVIALAALLLAPAVAAAQPDFSQSTIAHAPPDVSEGQVVTFNVLVRNTGNEAAPYTEIDLTLPLEAMLVAVSGQGATVDAIEKVVNATVDLPVGAEQHFAVRMVVPRDAGGRTLRPALRARYLHRAVAFETSESLAVGSNPATGGVAIGGGVRAAPAALTVFALVLLYPLLFALLPRRRDKHGIVAMLVISIGFLSIFAAMAWRDWQTLTAWQQSTCTVLDSRLRAETEQSRIPTGNPMRRREITTYQPLLALRYATGGEEIISTGYDTGSRLSIGGAARAAREYTQWQIGTAIPCWYDPTHPADVVVVRGFGGAYVFALLPLGLLVLALRSILGARRRRS